MALSCEYVDLPPIFFWFCKWVSVNRFDSSDFEKFNSISTNRRSSLVPGTILVAAPGLRNTPLERGVILVLQNNDNGVFGVMLNKPGSQELRSAWLQMTGTSEGEESLVHGGPIGGPVFAIHQDQSLAEMEIQGGVFISAASEKVEELIRQTGVDYRIFFGVAGWNHQQLSREMDGGCWLQINGSPEIVFESPDGMWEKSLRVYGANTMCDVIGLSSLPGDPQLN